MKIRQKLKARFVFYLLLMMSLLLAIILLCYTALGRNMRRQLEQNEQDALQDTVSRANERIESAIGAGTTAAGFGEISNFMSGNPGQRLELRDTVRYMLRSYVELKNGLCAVYVYTADGACLSVRGEMLSEHDYLKCMNIRQDVTADGALKRAYHSPQITKCYEFDGDVYYAVLTPVYPSSFNELGGTYMGTLIFIYSTEELVQSLPDSSTVETLIAQDEQIIASSSDAMRNMWTNGSRDTMLSRTMDKTGWTVWTAASTRQLEDRMAHFGNICIIMALGTAAVFIVLTLIQYKSIVAPILTISTQAKQLGTNDDDWLTAHFGVDELDHLVESINGMVASQRETSSEIIRIKLKYYEEQLVFLQSQINPHFLYNSFESIRGMASVGNTEMVREVASSMASIYRYCSSGASLSSLREEKECIIKYSRIVAMCYRNLYSVELDIPDETLDYPVPRMIFQPLVENAVMHGFARDNRKNGIVRLNVRYSEDTLIITVSDNGAGMTDEDLTFWNRVGARKEAPPEGHIGLGNVARRLDLIYGEKACMLFSRSPEGGLCIRILIKHADEIAFS